MVSLSKKTRDSVKTQFRDAIAAGKGPLFLEALRKIVDRLRRDPKQFGEFLYRLPNLKLEVYQGAVAPVLVDYAVHEERLLVFVRGISTLPSK